MREIVRREADVWWPRAWRDATLVPFWSVRSPRRVSPGRLLPAARAARRTPAVRPVLKHGPRSPATMQVAGRQTRARSESDSSQQCDGAGPRRLSRRRATRSMRAGTRKAVNYARPGRSQRKLWWRPAAVLTCKSMARAGYRGERLIEPPSSWFPLKFPSG